MHGVWPLLPKTSALIVFLWKEVSGLREACVVSFINQLSSFTMRLLGSLTGAWSMGAWLGSLDGRDGNNSVHLLSAGMLSQYLENYLATHSYYLSRSGYLFLNCIAYPCSIGIENSLELDLYYLSYTV